MLKDNFGAKGVSEPTITLIRQSQDLLVTLLLSLKCKQKLQKHPRKKKHSNSDKHTKRRWKRNMVNNKKKMASVLLCCTHIKKKRLIMFLMCQNLNQ